jgi:hypothetical protein
MLAVIQPRAGINVVEGVCDELTERSGNALCLAAAVVDGETGAVIPSDADKSIAMYAGPSCWDSGNHSGSQPGASSCGAR